MGMDTQVQRTRDGGRNGGAGRPEDTVPPDTHPQKTGRFRNLLFRVRAHLPRLIKGPLIYAALSTAAKGVRSRPRRQVSFSAAVLLAGVLAAVFASVAIGQSAGEEPADPLALYDSNDNGVIDADEFIQATVDYFNGLIDGSVAYRVWLLYSPATGAVTTRAWTSACDTYDEDDSGVIEGPEAIQAINDYLFNDLISKATMLAVLNCYYSGTHQIEISGLADTLQAGGSDEFTVTASNLLTSNNYTIKVSTNHSSIRLDDGCSVSERDIAVTVDSDNSDYSSQLTLYACSAPGGTVFARLIMGDDVGELVYDSQYVAVNEPPPPANRPPTVTINTSGQTVDGEATVSLDATAFDRDGDTLTYRWSGSGSFADDSALDTDWTAPAAQSSDREYVLTVEVSDGSLSASDSVSFTVRRVTPPANRSPTVTIHTSDQTVDGGATVSLDATAFDRDGDTLTYRWSGSGSFADDSALDTDWTAPAAQSSDREYVLTVEVSDGSLSATASVSFTVLSLPTITIAPHSTALQGVTEGSDVVFQLSPDPAPKTDLTVYLRVTDPGAFLDGTAPTQMTISKGHTTAYLTLKTLNDQVDEAHGTISAALRAGTGYFVGTASSASVTIKDNDKPPAPTELRANGHLVNEYVTLRWKEVSGATAYNVHYIKEICSDGGICGPDASASWRTVTNIATTGGTVKEANLEIEKRTDKTLYRIEVRAKVVDLSDWSVFAVVFPTNSAPSAGTKVATAKFHGYQPDNGLGSHEFRYVICEETVPAGLKMNIIDMKNAVAKWEDTVTWNTGQGNIITTNGYSMSSNYENCERDLYPPNGVAVKFYSAKEMIRALCINLRSPEGAPPACWRSPSWGAYLSVGPINNGVILVNKNRDEAWWKGNNGSGNCSNVHEYVVHEAGHGFGIGSLFNPHPVNTSGSVMSYDNTGLYCEPQVYDIVALMALYLSR